MGVTFGVMTIVIVAVVAQAPTVGVKVYVVVVVLLMAGDHVPEMPLVDVVGNAGITAPAQYGPT